MIQETRRIVFDFHETYCALFALCVQRDMPRPPPGMIRAVKVVDPGADGIALQIKL
jgi:hypothetical protein